MPFDLSEHCKKSKDLQGSHEMQKPRVYETPDFWGSKKKLNDFVVPGSDLLPTPVITESSNMMQPQVENF